MKQLVPKGSVGRSMQPFVAPKKRKAAKTSALLKRSRQNRLKLHLSISGLLLR